MKTRESWLAQRLQRISRQASLLFCPLLFGVGTAAMLLACGDEPEYHENLRVVRGTTSPVGAVLPVKEARKVLDQCTRATPWLVTRFWTPSDSIISALEQQLPLMSTKLTNKAVALDSMYYMQYVGLIYLNGRRTVYVNAFDKSYVASLNRLRTQVDGNDTFPWRMVPIVVCDGGWRFWSVEYDVREQRFGPIKMNDRAG